MCLKSKMLSELNIICVACGAGCLRVWWSCGVATVVISFCILLCTHFTTGLFGELGHRETSMGSSFWQREIGGKL